MKWTAICLTSVRYTTGLHIVFHELPFYIFLQKTTILVSSMSGLREVRMHGSKKVTSSRKKPLQSGHLSIYANNIGLTDVRFTRGSYAWFEKGHFFKKETSAKRTPVYIR